MTVTVMTKYDAAELPKENIRNDNFLARLFLTWVYEVVRKGRNGSLQPEELRMPGDQATEAAADKFQAAWQAEIARCEPGKLDKKGQQLEPSLLKALIAAFGRDVFIAGCWKCCWSVFVLLGAFYFVRSLVQFVTLPSQNSNMYNTNSIPNDGVGWILACTFFLDSILVGLALQRMGDQCVRAGIKIRGAVMTAVYRKTFKMTQLHNEESGNVVSLVATDCAKLMEGVMHLHNVWTAPLETAAIIALLLSLTGVYGLPALGVIVFVLPLQYYFGYRIAVYKLETVEVSDARVLRMHEVLLAIKLVKFYVWEKSFAKQVEKIREDEIKLMSRTSVIKTLNLCLVFAVPPCIALVIFACYVFNKGLFDSVFSFTILSLFNTLRFPLVVLPKALRGTSEAIASLKRLQQFLLLSEATDKERSKDVEVNFEKAVLSHPSSKEDWRLVLPTFHCKPGEVAAIVGRVGAGKSSIFAAILNSMKLEEGQMRVGGTIAYVPQTPWVQNLSLRENILFGLPYDEAKYKAVIHACALELDLQILPNGDQTLGGERGINLSGGQRQRVGLARAAYHDCEMVLLDNPLSAVDQHTARHIFDHCIKGLLKDKAVIWITHQLELLPNCNHICIMEGGKSVYFGPYDGQALNEFLPVDHLLFATVEAGESGIKKSEGDKAKGELNRPSKAGMRKSFQRSSNAGIKPVDSVCDALHSMAAEEEEQAALAGTVAIADQGRRNSNDLKKVSEEHVKDVDETPEQIAAQFNGVPQRLPPGKAFMVYWRAGGLVLGIVSMIFFMAAQTTRIFSDLWIRFWAADNIFPDIYRLHLYASLWPPSTHKPNNTYRMLSDQEGSTIYICSYMAMVVLFIVLLLSRDSSFSIWHIRASTNMHNSLFRRVLHAPILFFLRTPVGDILNAFSKDQDTLDETLPDTLHMSTIYFMILVTSLAIVTTQVYYYAALTAALFAAFGMMQFIYLPAATLLKRWAGATASMVFVHVDESLTGMDVIKAFDATNYFIQENVRRINTHHLALFNTEQCHLWLAFWCDFFGAILVVATCLFAVGLKDDLGPAAVGLAISNSIQVLVFFTWVVRGVADTVSMWDAVERVTTFIRRVPEEAQVAAARSSLQDDSPPPPEPGGRSTPPLGKTSTAHTNGNGNVATANSVATVSNGSGMGLPNHSTLGLKGANGELEEIKVQLGSDDEVEAITAKVLEHWPSQGDIQFQKVCLRYYPGAPLALKFVTFHIKDKEKIGVVGRTGSGKTTLLMALFRMFELAFGKIVIDGIDIARLPLRDVRSRIAIIPQEPVMFKGTVRSNLDPFNEKTDAELWTALKLVHLKKSVKEMPGGLDAVVAEGGSNFSLGQKQLACMARCVLKDTRILVLDEATAAMDLQTDILIQKTIRRVFKGRTTITIAHRLDTIIFSDRILAMAAGQCKEFDTPTRLLGAPWSMFNSLVEDTGPHASAALRRMAAEGPQGDDDEDDHSDDDDVDPLPKDQMGYHANGNGAPAPATATAPAPATATAGLAAPEASAAPAALTPPDAAAGTSSD